jgi:hypothetical protein
MIIFSFFDNKGFIYILTPYIALVTAILPFILLIRELLFKEANKPFDRYNFHFHALIVSVFVSIGVSVAKLNPSNLVDSLSFFGIIVSIFFLYDKKFKNRVWSISYVIFSFIALFFLLTSLLNFLKIIDNIPIVTILTPYFALMVAIIAYSIVLYEFRPKKYKYCFQNKNKFLFFISTMGIAFALLVFLTNSNPSNYVDGFSFIAFAFTTIFYVKFDD